MNHKVVGMKPEHIHIFGSYKIFFNDKHELLTHIVIEIIGEVSATVPYFKSCFYPNLISPR